MTARDFMAVGFAALDKRINRDTEQLHDHLWHSQVKKDPTKLRANLGRDVRDADAFLRLGGKLRNNANALIDAWGAPGAGESLFELMEHSWGLAAATVLAGRGEYKRAAERCKNVIASASIGVCANVGCFDYVEEWEAGKIDFETYTGKLADFLEAKGIVAAGQFKRLLNAIWDFGTNWETSASDAQQAVAVRASIENTGWCLHESVRVRKATGRPPMFSSEDFEEILRRIAVRL